MSLAVKTTENSISRPIENSGVPSFSGHGGESCFLESLAVSL